jgi:hypothetical protein
MSLSTLLLAIWLILVGLTWLTWVNISIKFLGGLALVTGIVFLLEGLSVFSYNLPARRRD